MKETHERNHSSGNHRHRGHVSWNDSAQLIWKAGTDAPFWIAIISWIIASAAMVWAYSRLARAARNFRANASV
ncbi:MAG: hypothetical protein DLM52_10700 [Chthoniobacterales bacterium]|nr:MAG: hypothetical protein DLM52_10700 [Chthoniobacterales bacterium]